MQLTLLKGYPDFVGKRATFVGYGSGPSSYSQATGDVVSIGRPNYYIDAIAGGVFYTADGTYVIRAIPSGVGARQTWALFWYTASNGTPVANGTNLSAEQLQIGGFCGQY